MPQHPSPADPAGVELVRLLHVNTRKGTEAVKVVVLDGANHTMGLALTDDNALRAVTEHAPAPIGRH
jgi:hypothetical protein